MSPDSTASRITSLRLRLAPFHSTAVLFTSTNHCSFGSGSTAFFER